MESLSLGEARPFTYSSNGNRQKERRRRSHRLPTPDASRSSDEAFEPSNASMTPRHGPPMHNPFKYPSPVRYSPMSPLHDAHNIRHDRRQTCAPDSPPYSGFDAQKPSLPPLKTVLGNDLSSPPQTPTSYSISNQLSPREPAFTAATYKPPSLYPNKKPRIDLVPEPAPSILPISTLGSPGPRSTTYDFRPTAASSQAQPPYSTYPSYANNHPARRMSVQPTSTIPQSDGILPNRPTAQHMASANTPHHYHAPEPTPPTTGFYHRRRPSSRLLSRPPRHSSVSEPTGAFAPPCDPGLERRASTDVYGSASRDARPYDPIHARDLPRPQYEHHAPPPPMRDGVVHTPRGTTVTAVTVTSGGRQVVGPPPGTALGPPPSHPLPYDDVPPPFFFPNHYDYQNGKARKRSNLPKQSTEIMKTWFDQNITNPYPSEEQKAIFSNATGISMTQVSNWFINHRRRCPELRDKREKGRGGGEVN